MAKKLINKKYVPQDTQLIKKEEAKFVLAFKDKLEGKYNFDNFSVTDIKNFQKFLDKISKMTITQVDNAFLRSPDHNDKIHDISVQHYEYTDGGRIHGYFIDKVFYVIRVDKNHRYHK